MTNYTDIPGLSIPNEMQMAAVEIAMRRSFSLIQGPPGTGKTVTAVRLAAMFVELNRRRSSLKNVKHSQVLICGPSNKSVDVIAGMVDYYWHVWKLLTLVKV